MDPSNYLRIVINNLAIRFPSEGSNLPSSLSFFCKIKLTHFPSQSAPIPIIPSDAAHPDPYTLSGSVCLTLARPDIQRFVAERSSKKVSKRPAIKIDVYSRKGSGCGFGSGKLLGRVSVPVDLTQQAAEGKGGMVVKNGWVEVGERNRSEKNPELYLSVKVHPDPRFLFEFDSEPECSPQVFQAQGSIRQPVFSCKFSCRNYSGDLRSSSRLLKSAEKDHNHHHSQSKKERKGWSVTVHDLSGSPVAAASMVTPFVPSKGSGRVSRSNPGAWLVLRPGDGAWIPWGRLEAWREQGDRVGYRFELCHDLMGPDGITLAQSTVPAGPGGKFTIDVASGRPSPPVSRNSSLDLGSGYTSSSSSSSSSSGSESGWCAGLMYKGFVMSSRVGGGKAPVVEVGSQHVTCTEDAAVFVALAAAMDLSMDACRPFTQKLRKELRQPSGEIVV